MPDIEIGPIGGGSARLRGYLAVPEGDGPWPGVVAIHEALGLNDILRRQADRLAAAGYLTLGPDLFSDGGAARCVVGTFRALVAGHGKPLADIDAARVALAERDDCTGRIGVIGFCMGGGFALLAAPAGFDAAAVNYGMLPRHVEDALAGSCPIVASYGRKDPMLPRGTANKLTRTLVELGVEHDVKQYPEAGARVSQRCVLRARAGAAGTARPARRPGAGISERCLGANRAVLRAAPYLAW